jgi:hypothetical protein
MKTMVLFFGFTMLAIVGCKKVDEWTQFEMDFHETAVVPASSGVNLPFNILTPEVETNSASTFAVNDTHKDLVEEIKITTLNLSLTSPSGGDFGFLKSISIFASAEGIPETKSAWKDTVPESIGAFLDLEITDLDLKEFIKKDEFSLRLNTVTDEFLAEDHYIDVYSVFFVNAKVLGQ